jgi:hypothetical protein
LTENEYGIISRHSVAMRAAVAYRDTPDIYETREEISDVSIET